MDQSIIADLIVAFHFGYVIIVVSGLFIIFLGGALRWRFIRIFWLRAIHLAMIMAVVFESIFGISCPLTDLEYDLRIAAGQYDASPVSFIARLIHKLIFYEFPEFVFTIGYCLFGLTVLISWRLIPPLLPWKRDKAEER
jgi:hypothetical protein